MKIKNLFFLCFIILGLTSCSNDDDNWSDSTSIELGNGIFVLNEGLMNYNNASLDFFNYETGEYISNVFTKVNPTIVNGLGDIGNDLKVYDGKLYAVINGSNYIEVMNATTAKHIGQIKVDNCRYITFDKGYAYISSFAGPILPNTTQLGIVYKINTTTLSIEGEVIVGFQPEEMAIVNNKLYVANSGGYTSENYDNTVSVIDLNTFKEINKITVGPNLWRLKSDKNKNIWVTSRGNYPTLSPSISVINPNTDEVEQTLNNVTVSDFAFYGNSLYFYGTEWIGSTPTNGYGVIDINTKSITSNHFINESVEAEIKAPYGIAINPANGDIFIADASNYTSPGKLYYFDTNGNLKTEQFAGITPGHFAFLEK